MPVTTEGTADGSTMRRKIWTGLAPRHSAARTRIAGVAITPWMALSSTTKKLPQKIRKYFEFSPMPNHTTAIGIIAALFQRHATGRGQEVKSALFENNVFLVAQHMMEALMTGKPAAPMPDRIRAWAVYDTFTTADDERVFVGVVSDTQWKVFCEAFDRPDLLADPALKTNPQRVEARSRVIPIVADIFAKMWHVGDGAACIEGAAFIEVAVKPHHLVA